MTPQRSEYILKLEDYTYGHRYAWKLKECKESELKETYECAVKSALRYEKCKND